MKTDKQYADQLRELKVGEECGVYIFEEGGGLVRRSRCGGYHLFEIPQYGGIEQYHGYFQSNEVETLLEEVRSWT